MIFVGDVAIARGDRFVFAGFPGGMLRRPWCVNLEGAVAVGESRPEWGVYNDESWIDSFANFSLGPVFLGNNHVHDVPNGIGKTIDHLTAIGAGVFGAGSDETAASMPALYECDGVRYALLGFGWPVIGCRPAGRNSPGVNRLDGRRVRSQLHRVLAGHPDARIVVVIHGNYEFELYPQPGHRRLSKELIDSGAYAVIWHHPHIVGPIERYRERTIAYSLGNWAFSHGRFLGGRLAFPEISFRQIALELGQDGDVVHHALFEAADSVVRYVGSERVGEQDFTLRAEFEGMPDEAYERWFRKNRVKRRGLPIYYDADDTMANRLKDGWVRFRQFFVDAAGRAGIKPMRSRA